jgi:hypothetical protein
MKTTENYDHLKGVFLTRKLLIICIVLIISAYAATVFGLVFGLKNARKPDQSSANNQTTNSTLKQNTTIQYQKNHRLPVNLKPYYYDVRIEAKFDKYTKPVDFDGYVRVDMDCVQSTNTIVLHASNIHIYNDSLSVKGITQVDFETKQILMSFDADMEFLILNLSKFLDANQKYSLFIKYKGFVNDKPNGLFRRSYKDDQNIIRYVFVCLCDKISLKRPLKKKVDLEKNAVFKHKNRISKILKTIKA